MKSHLILSPTYAYDATVTMADLAEIPTEDLMKEVQRRLQCQQKPEKRLILVGKNQHLLKKRETRDERRETRER